MGDFVDGPVRRAHQPDGQQVRVKYTPDWQPTELHIEATQAAAAQACAHDVVRHDDRNQRDHPEQRDDLEDGPGFGPHDRAAEQLLSPATRCWRRGSRARAAGTELPAYVAAAGGDQDHRQERLPTERLSAARRVRSPTKVRSSHSRIPGGALDATVASICARAPGAPRDSVRGTATHPVRSRDRRDPFAAHPESDRYRRHHPGSRIQPRWHPHDAAWRRAAPASRQSCWSADRDRWSATRSWRGSRSSRSSRVRSRRQGFIVLRYDKRGVGQSGGRSERVTLQDYADDLIVGGEVAGEARGHRSAAHRRRRPQRGRRGRHARGGAREEDRVARAHRSPRAARHRADPRAAAPRAGRDETPDAERQAKIELQKKIQAAVIADKGWEGIPPALRAQADSPGSGASSCSIPRR